MQIDGKVHPCLEKAGGRYKAKLEEMELATEAKFTIDVALYAVMITRHSSGKEDIAVSINDVGFPEDVYTVGG